MGHMTSEEIIWETLCALGATEAGASGVMGNLQAESGLSSINLQNTGNTALGMSDQQYTTAVDQGVYVNFSNDRYGYGICQWTSSNRKERLQLEAKIAGVSVGDLELQLTRLWKELQESYQSTLKTICSTDSVQVAASAFMLDFERPADKSIEAQKKRGDMGEVFYKKYKKGECEMSNVAEIRYNTVAECPSWAQSTIQRMVDSKEIAGTGEGLDLSMDMIRTFVCLEKMLNRKG